MGFKNRKKLTNDFKKSILLKTKKTRDGDGLIKKNTKKPTKKHDFEILPPSRFSSPKAPPAAPASPSAPSRAPAASTPTAPPGRCGPWTAGAAGTSPVPWRNVFFNLFGWFSMFFFSSGFLGFYDGFLFWGSIFL